MKPSLTLLFVVPTVFHAFDFNFYCFLNPERGRLKTKRNTGFNSSSLEAYFNHPVKTHFSNGNSSQSCTSSPTQPGLPQVLCSTVDNQPKIPCLPVDLNEKRKLLRSSLGMVLTWA